MNTLLNWIHANQGAAFVAGLFLLIAFTATLNFINSAIQKIVYAWRGVPPKVTVKCCCNCHDEHEDENETEQDY